MGSSPVGLKTPIGRARGIWNLSTDQEWKTPETEQECLEYYQEKIAHGQHKRLLPLQEDLADWLNKTLNLDHITATNLLDILDNGVVLCHLAMVIHERVKDAVDTGLASGPVPVIKGPFFEKANRRSFYSRDNLEKFITFCKHLGVHPNLLFETNDLVQQNQPRNVVLCLMEVSRIASRYNLEPPKLVALEKEIAEEESRELAATWTPPASNIKHSSSDGKMMYIQEGGCGVGESLRRTASEHIAPDIRDASPTDTTDDDWSRAPSLEDHSELDNSACGLNDLDIKVKSVARVAQKQCQCGTRCDKLKVKKVGEGKYNIAGRNVFVRLLKGRHMMVRVGGGWDTLEHFLQRHDPCQARVVSRPVTPASSGKIPRPYSALQSYGVHSPSHTPHTLAR
ncbi:growth arrest-specific protein 2-like isoform X1 [Cimex lectularius]|uniref:Growth arrest-specific protein 2 n=1 Tax=Cimex lectularius TaxID=79782 RepID=A0A8I6SU11_CIMLE|nr:growth arrest-specific protein 2-like isoform X1 [Cimex lectularius]